MARGKASNSDLQATAQSREAMRRLDLQEQYVWLLRKARATAQLNRYMTTALDATILSAEEGLRVFVAQAGGRIEGRRRSRNPTTPPPGATATVFLDECGDHSMRSKDRFGAFVLGAIVVADEQHGEFDSAWKAWKATYLGSAEKLVHEPDIRAERKSFWCDGDTRRRRAAVASLSGAIERLPFMAVASVLHRGDYREMYGTGAPNETLPGHAYLMSLGFITERLVFLLDRHLGGRRARVVAESRGPKEDAMLQAEFARLHLDGTSYVSAAYIRQHLEPGIHFQNKQANLSGLQIADLLARPCGEKVLDWQATPDRWSAFRRKLCDGQETLHSIIGFKVFPWHERYDSIWTS